MQKSERKREILLLLFDERPLTVDEIAMNLGLGRKNINALCFRYYKQGLLNRYKDDVYYYGLSQRGHERLQYLI